MSDPSLTRSLSDFFWIKLPRVALRFSAFGGVALADGSYLRAWTRWSAAAPSAAALVGVVLGVAHPEELYTYSLVVIAILGVVSALGAGLGCWTLAGFAAADFFFGRDQSSYLTPSFDLHGVQVSAALFLSYVLLAGLLVVGPVLANAVRLAISGSVVTASVVSGAALVVVHSVVALLWTQSTPFMIRPVWSYFGRSPAVQAIEPLQQRGWILALVIGLSAIVRLYLERRASTRLDPLGMPALAGGLRKPLPWWVAVVGRTLFVTFLLSGLLSSWLVVAATAAALGAIFFFHIRVLPGIPRYVETVGRVPIALRGAVVCALAYGAGNLFVQRAVERGSQSFASLIFATLISLLFVALLLPERPRPDVGPRLSEIP